MSSAITRRALIAFCRPGFEGEAAQELTALASERGVAGYARTERGTALVEFVPTPEDGMDRLLRTLGWRETVFCRQLLEGYAQASAMDRTDRLASLLPAIRASGMRYRDARVEAPDSDACRELAALCRALNSALVGALKKEKLLDPNAPQRLHVVLTAADAALVARVEIEQGPIWPGGIPRLKFPHEAPSRSTLKLDEGLLVLLDDDERERWLKPGMTAVDLGAAPGGWTWQLVRRSIHVTAIDNGPMDSRLMDSGLVEHHRVDGFRYQPPKPVDWMVCDMVEQPRRVAARMAEWLAEGWCRMTMFNLKLPMKKRLDEVNLCRGVFTERLGSKNLEWRARQLYHDREEVTVFARVAGH
ncbi:MAG: 23S rRNA (cytidine(2498)-2'-O)-methyltransferase RlmM [Dokdonella sp.]